MRAGRMNKGLVKDDHGKILGISLGADFCAEHEWGIKDTNRYLGLNPDEIGVKARTTTVFEEDHFVFFEDKRFVVLLFSTYKSSFDRLKKDLEEEGLTKLYNKGNHPFCFRAIAKPKEDDFEGAWSDRDFGVVAKKKSEAGEYVKRLYEAFKEKDVMIMVGAPKLAAFDRGGLLLSVASELPQEVHDTMEEGDKDILALEEADEATGIKKLLEEKDKSYMALSPRWLKDMHGDWPETKHPVVYWLNPFDQRNNNYGYFTVEQLEQWADNKGPIPMKQKA